MPRVNYNTEYKYVVTPHAAELSWLFTELWQVFRQHDEIDHMTKFEFFRRPAFDNLLDLSGCRDQTIEPGILLRGPTTQLVT